MSEYKKEVNEHEVMTGNLIKLLSARLPLIIDMLDDDKKKADAAKKKLKKTLMAFARQHKRIIK